MIKTRIAKLVKEYGYITFPELLAKIPEAEGDQYIALPEYSNIWLWSGLSTELADAIAELLGERQVFVHPASKMTKLSYGGTLNLPEATSAKDYAQPHWFISVLHHSPFEGKK